MGETEAKTAQTIKRAAGTIMIATIVSRLLGWVKLTSLSALYGRTLETDTFLAAFALPDLLYLLVSGGAMTAAFIPIFTEYLASGRKKEAWRVASTIWNQIAIVLIIFIFAGEVFAGKVVLLMPGFHRNAQALAYATIFVRLLYPMVLFTALAAMCNGVLHSHNHFTAPSVSWIIYNVFFIIAAYASYRNIGLRGVCIGVLAGALAMVLVQLPVMIKKGMYYRIAMDRKHPAVKKYWQMFLPMMLGMSLTQINLMIMPVIFGSLVGAGAITALNLSNRMMFIPLGVFGSAISMAIFPTMSRMAASGDFAMADRVLTRGIRATLIFSLPCSALLITAGLPSIIIVFGHGKFGFNDCVATTLALSCFAVGLMGHAANQTINRGFYSRKDSITPMIAGLVGIGVTIPLALVLIKTPLKHGGVALAVSIATLLNMVILLAKARNKLSIDIKGIAVMFSKTMVATAAMGFVGWAVGGMFHLGPQRFGMKIVMADFLAIGISSCLVFAGLAKLMKIEEFDEMVGMALKKFKRA